MGRKQRKDTVATVMAHAIRYEKEFGDSEEERYYGQHRNQEVMLLVNEIKRLRKKVYELQLLERIRKNMEPAE